MSFFETGWEDIVPIPQYLGENIPCPISYKKDHEEAMDYFRAILKANEKSARALLLAEKIIEVNPANYSAWHHKRQCLFEMEHDLKEELETAHEACMENPKNYQVWHHIRLLVEKIGEPMDELSFIEEALLLDSKNYHAWAYRQWIIRTFKIWEGELEYSEKLLKFDCRNNSAWNQRWFVVSNTCDLKDMTILKRELEYAFEIIQRVPHNESAWTYVIGLLRKFGDSLTDELKGFVNDEASSIIEKHAETCRHAYAVKVRLFEQAKDFESAKENCLILQRVDKVRSKYWKMIHDQL
eukprot:TRINITY_DN17875_c0_g1_i1.p1 TRINITY_DN17875_c0_g1~~TRINITY_DN17875_c0_g1_i1.p1  ORF type:complete len:296 (-),score=60.49 TRINITY_DN17875_c0_g1_i1:147-1034(-)